MCKRCEKINPDLKRYEFKYPNAEGSVFVSGYVCGINEDQARNKIANERKIPTNIVAIEGPYGTWKSFIHEGETYGWD